MSISIKYKEVEAPENCKCGSKNKHTHFQTQCAVCDSMEFNEYNTCMGCGAIYSDPFWELVGIGNRNQNRGDPYWWMK